MRYLIKNILRYSLNNKLSLVGLFILFSICMSSLLTLGLLSFNFTDSYTKVITNGNEHNIVINEMYTSGIDGEKNKEMMLNSLTSSVAKENGFNARRFEGLEIQSNVANKIMVIKYEPSYPSQYNVDGKQYVPMLTEQTLPTDNLQVFMQSGLPYLKANYLSQEQNFYHLPSSIDFTSIANYVLNNYPIDLVGPIKGLTPKQQKILKARQAMIYFLAKGENAEKKYKDALNTIVNTTIEENVSKVDPKQMSDPNGGNVKGDFSVFFNDKNNKFNFPIIDGYSINFQVSQESSVIKFEDYNSRICVVPPALLRYHNKDVYSYNQFRNDLTNSIYKTNNDSIFDVNTMNYSQFTTYFDSIDKKYKVKVDNIDYLIVGSGITPDFFYPIISMQNVVVDFQDEFVIYTNNNGFNRTHGSFQSAPLESLMLIKYTGNQPIPYIINQLQNQLAIKYLAFPSNVQSVFLASDDNNIFSPTALRINFISQLVSSINAITVILSIFLVLVTLFIVVIILKKFITENLKTLFILVAQGISKLKATISILFIPLIPCFLASIFSYLLAYFTQPNVFKLFSPYWSINIASAPFNLGILLLVFIGFYLIVSVVIFAISFVCLNQPVSQGITTQSTKLNKLAIWAKKPFEKFNVKVRFRVSLAFGSFGKLIFLSLTLFLFSLTTSFIGSTFNLFDASLSTVTNTNNSVMQMNLITPTRNGGQYYGVSFADAGKTLYLNDDKNTTPLNKPSVSNTSSPYYEYYNGSKKAMTPLFKEWANMMYVSIKDAINQKEQLRYLANVTNWEFTMNIAVGGLFNPWTKIVSPLLPANQRNSSLGFNNDLMNAILKNNSVIKTSAQTFPKNIFNDLGIVNANINRIYLTSNNYPLNYVLENGEIFPIIKLSNLNINKENLLDISQSEIQESLNNFGDVFSGNILVSNIKLDKDKILVQFNKEVTCFTPRNVFEKLFEKANVGNSIISIVDPITNQNREFNKASKKLSSLLPGTITPAFINFSIYLLQDPDFINYLYKNSYNSIILNQGDEAYTFVDASIKSQINSSYDYDINIPIIGIQESSKFIKLTNDKNELINQKLFNYDLSKNVYPLIPNLYAKKLYNLKIGDEITIFVNNNVDRYNPKLSTPIIKSKANINYDKYVNVYTKTFKVVDFANSTKDAEFYTSMIAAQKSIGLAYNNSNNNIQIDNPWDQTIYPNINNVAISYSLNNQYNNFGGFNGIFSGNNLIGLSNEIALYSPSGLYPGTSEFSQSINIIKELFKYNLVGLGATDENLKLISSAMYLTNNEQTLFIQKCNNIKTQSIEQQNQLIIDVINELSTIYRKSIYYAMIETPSSVEATVSTFSTLTKLITNVELIVIILIAILSIIILIMTCWIIIKDMMQLIVLLKVQGESDWSNALNIFAIFIPTWILSMLITIPALYGGIYLFSEFVFMKMGLVLFASFNWLAFFCIFIGIGAFLVLLMYIANLYIKKINLVESLKW